MTWIAALWQIIARGFPAITKLLGQIRLMLGRTRFGNFLMQALAGTVGAVLVRVLTFTGLSLVAYNFGTPLLVQYVAGPMLGLPSDWQAFLSMTRIDDALTVMLSALAFRASMAVKLKTNNFWMRGVGG
jgi:hypothetical protein